MKQGKELQRTEANLKSYIFVKLEIKLTKLDKNEERAIEGRLDLSSGGPN